MFFFRPNPDGRTVYENVYAWNKAAHILYIDSPRNVGFSFQDTTQNTNNKFDDDQVHQKSLNKNKLQKKIAFQTVSDLYIALEDFFLAHPNYAQTVTIQFLFLWQFTS